MIESVNDTSAGPPTPAMDMSNPISKLTYDLGVLPGTSHRAFLPLIPSQGYNHAPAKLQRCLHHHDPFPFCDSLLSLMGFWILPPGKDKVHAWEPTSGLLSAHRRK